MYVHIARRTAVGVMAASALALSAAAAVALEPAGDEKEQLKACEEQICGIVLKKDSAQDLACKVSKTWTKSKIVDGVKEKKISWTFGDARCDLDVKVVAKQMVEAVSAPAHTLQFDKHTIACQVEREAEVTPVKISLAPKIEFKDGKATKAWLNVSEIEAPTLIKGAIWTVTKLEDTVGLFHGEIIGEINEFVHQKCPARYPR